MIQPLDYTFFFVIFLTLSYKMWELYRDFYRTNPKTINESDLIILYGAVIRLKKWKQRNISSR